MKKILQLGIKTLIVAVVATIITVKANAQGNPGGPGSNGSGTYGNGSPVGGPIVPFDGGMSLMLLASGIGYGVKKLRKE